MRGRPLQPITLAPEMRDQLQSMVRSRSLSQGLTRRAKIVLLATQGMRNKDIAPSSSTCRGQALPGTGIFLLVPALYGQRPGHPQRPGG